MKRKNTFSWIAAAAALALCLGLAGCGQSAVSLNASSSVPAVSAAQTATGGGALCLKVNPEIDIRYDAKGLVTAVEGRNADGKALVEDGESYLGKECRQVVSELVAAIGKAGYFVEEVEGQSRQITIEIEKGSQLPTDTFLAEILSDVKDYVNTADIHSPVEVRGESDYGMTDYHDTDYGPNNDGVTDYDDTDYGPNNDGVTDYDDTDYGPNNDGVTDYDDTDYGPNNDGVTDYDDTDYGPNNDGVTDYDDTDYGPHNDGVTDYTGATDYEAGHSDYGSAASNYGDSDYHA